MGAIFFSCFFVGRGVEEEVLRRMILEEGEEEEEGEGEGEGEDTGDSISRKQPPISMAQSFVK